MDPGEAPEDAEQASSPPAQGASGPEHGSEHCTTQILPSVREHLPSLMFGAALPVGVYFLARSHVHTDAQALIAAGCVSVGWILVQFAARRRVDFVAVIVLSGFAVGVVSSTLLGGNAYVLKVRDGFFTLLLGVVFVVTLFTNDRPALFYVSRYLSAGNDPRRMSAFDRLHEVPVGRRSFRILSVLWGIGLVVEASLRMTLADLLPTGTFLAVSPFLTATVIGSLFAFTALYSKRAQEAALALPPATVRDVPETGTDAGGAQGPGPGPVPGDG